MADDIQYVDIINNISCSIGNEFIKCKYSLPDVGMMQVETKEGRKITVTKFNIHAQESLVSRLK
jgi:hypothetical protein